MAYLNESGLKQAFTEIGDRYKSTFKGKGVIDATSASAPDLSKMKDNEVWVYVIASGSSVSGGSVTFNSTLALSLFKTTNSVGASLGDLLMVLNYNGTKICHVWPLNDAKAADGSFPGADGLETVWDKTQINKIPSIQNSVAGIENREAKTRGTGNMNEALDSGFYPYCTLGRPSGSDEGAWYTLRTWKSKDADSSGFYTIEQLALCRGGNFFGRVYYRQVYHNADDSSQDVFMDWTLLNSDKEALGYSEDNMDVELSFDQTNNEYAAINATVTDGFGNSKATSNGSYRLQKATQTGAGLMSGDDKKKLDGIAAGANSYSLPTAASGTLGGIKTGYTTSGNNRAVQVDSNGNAYVTQKDTTYEKLPATETSNAGTINSGSTTGMLISPTQYNCIIASIQTAQLAANSKTASAYCSTAAATAAKVATHTGFVLRTNSYLLLTLTTANTAASALTLNVNSTGAKPIYINGTVSSASNYTLPAGTYLVYYNGTNYYFRTDNYVTTGNLVGNVSGTASTITSTLPITKGGTGKTSAIDAAVALGVGPALIQANMYPTVTSNSSSQVVINITSNSSATLPAYTYIKYVYLYSPAGALLGHGATSTTGSSQDVTVTLSTTQTAAATASGARIVACGAFIGGSSSPRPVVAEWIVQ